jgi:hypothetical protein
MNIFEAFAQLDRLNEAVTDDLRNVAAEIASLEKEINDLKDQKRKTAGSFTKESEEIDQLKAELEELKKSYKEFSHMEREYDDDRYWDYEVFVDNREKKAAVAEQEAALLKKLAELEANYKKLKAEATAEHDKNIADRTTALKAKKDIKKATIKTIIEENKEELDKLIAVINESITVTPNWEGASYKNDKIYVELIGETQEYDVGYDDIEFDSDSPYIDIEKIYGYLEETAEEDLGCIGDALGTVDISQASKNDLLEIPGSSWKLLVNYEIDTEGEPEVYSYEYYPATYWDSASEDIDYDKTWDWKAKFYLVKEI